MSVPPAQTPRPTNGERDAIRLRALLAILQRRFAAAEPGGYLATDDGGLDGPYPDIRQAARDCAADGLACTVVIVGERLEAECESEPAVSGIASGGR